MLVPYIRIYIVSYYVESGNQVIRHEKEFTNVFDAQRFFDDTKKEHPCFMIEALKPLK